MKYIIIGLGNFGRTLAITLTQMGHEVIGVDCNMDVINDIKNRITHAVCIDTTKPQSLHILPFKGTDQVIIGIGSDQGANIMTAAVLKQSGIDNIICRATSKLHQTVLESMGIEQIVFPEQEEAERLAMKLEFNEVINTFSLSDAYKIVEVEAPEWCHGKTIGSLALPQKFNLLILTLLKEQKAKNLLGLERTVKSVAGIATFTDLIEPNDVMVLFGPKKDIKRFVDQ